MHLLVLNRLAHPDAAEWLRAAGWEITALRANPDPALDDPANAAAFATADVLHVSLPGRVSADLLARMPRLRLVTTVGAGYQNVDVEAATASGIAVANQSGVGNVVVAEHAVGLMLALSRRLVSMHNDFVAQGWRARGAFQRRLSAGYATVLAGKTAGIVGLGHIGARIARTLRAGFDMRVAGYSPATPQAVFDELDAERVDNLDSLCARADFLVVVTNYTPQKHHMIGAAQLAAMKPTAVLVNAGRGPLIDQQALHDALKAGRIAGAGLDVFDPEPTADAEPLLKLDNVVLTPHVAGLAKEVEEALARAQMEQLRQLGTGARPERIVNPGVWDKRRR